MGMTSGGGGGAGGGVTSDINVTPMADIMLVLLIIFVITAPLLQEGIQVNKASARNAQEAPEVEGKDATTVTITRQEEIYVNSEAVAPEKLYEQLADRILLADGKPIFVKSDVAAPFGVVVDVLNKARDAGWERIGPMVDREKDGGT